MKESSSSSFDFSFPPLPSSVSEVGSLVASGGTDPTALAEIVKHDPSITVNVLQRVNSAYYGIRRRVESIDQAVRLLGFIEVCAITMIEGMSEMEEHFTDHAPIFQRILRASVFTGRFAENLTQALDLPREGTRLSFSSGLICSTGRLVLLHTVPARYAALVEEVEAPLPGADDESRAFGVSHQTLAPEACTYWELPERICSVLRDAGGAGETSDGPRATLVQVIRAGGRLASQDLADEPFEVSKCLQGIEADGVADLALDAAEDASAYATGVGGF